MYVAIGLMKLCQTCIIIYREVILTYFYWYKIKKDFSIKREELAWLGEIVTKLKEMIENICKEKMESFKQYQYKLLNIIKLA